MSWILIAAILLVGALFVTVLLASRARRNELTGYSPSDPGTSSYDAGALSWSSSDSDAPSFSGGGGDFGGGGATGSWDSGSGDSGGSDSGDGGGGGGGDGGGGD